MEHLKTSENQLAVQAKSVVFGKCLIEKVECEICLEEYLKDKLEEHREICIVRLMFRCSICDGDYVSKEGLSNHLDLHGIADESKELHCQEMRATYKMHQCTLCNDQRGYQENLFWKHVYEAHKGFFQRCSVCGENFQSQKLKADHDLTHCQTREQTVAGGLEAVKFSNKVLPMHAKTTTSLVSCTEMHENAAEQLEPSQKEQSYVPLEDFKCSEINIIDQLDTLEPENINEDNHIQSGLSEFSPVNSIFDCNTDLTVKESEVISIAICKSRNETKADAEKTPQSHVENSSTGSSNISKRFSCELCGHKFTNVCSVGVHIRRVHHTERNLRNSQVDLMNHKNQQEQKPADQITLKMEITVEETTLLQHDTFEISTLNQSTITYSPDLSQHAAVEEVLDLEPSSVNCSGQSSASTPGRKTDGYTKIDSANDFMSSDREKEDSLLIENSHASPHNASDINNVTKKKPKVNPIRNKKGSSKTKAMAENTLQPLVDNVFSGSSDTKCLHCGKKCSSTIALTRHIVGIHVPHTCDVCGISFSNYVKARYHKITKHMEAKHKCSHCPKVFQNEKHYQAHLSCCGRRKFSCEFCDQKFKASIYVVRHMENVHKIKGAVKKVLIDRIGCNEEKEQNHAKNFDLRKKISVEGATSNQLVIIDCRICGENFDDQSQVSHHVEAIHQMTMCASCGMTFASADQLNDHKLTCSTVKILQLHGGTSSSVLSGTVCPHCDKDCCHEALLVRHIAWCHQPVVCSTCGDTLSGKNRISYHKMKYHSEPKFKCPHCSKKFHLNNNYRRHVSNHGKNKKFTCKLCDLKFKSTLTLKDHMRLTHNLKDYQSDHTDCNELEQEPQSYDDVNLIQSENIELKMEIQVEETTLLEQKYQAPDEDRAKSPSINCDSQLKACKVKRRVKLKFSCKKCNREFTGIRAFRKHANEHMKKKNDRDVSGFSHAANDQMEKCSICGLTFENLSKMKYHMQVSHKERKFKCSLCPLTFAFAYMLRCHEKIHSKISKLLCNKCDLKFTSQYKFNYHMKRFHTEPGFKCPGCGKLYNLQCAFRNHINVCLKAKRKRMRENKEMLEHSIDYEPENETEFKDEYPQDEKVPCPICGRIFENNTRLEYHKRTAHTEPQHKCSYCPKIFHLMTSLRRHETAHSKILEAEGSLVCNLCPERFPDESGLERHIANVHPSSEMSCDKCDLMFTTRYKLHYHMKKIHTEPGFKCPDCGKLCNFQYALRRHMATHLKAKQKRMKESPEMSEQQINDGLEQNQNSTLQNVESESLDHENEIEIKEDKSKVCSICGLKIVGNMNYHKSIAHTEPKHKCSHCSKMFYSISKLNRHKTSHSKILERKEVCNLCPKKFRDEFSLKRHVTFAHPPSELSCGMCDLKFSTHSKLLYHVRTIHKPRFKCPECDKPFHAQYALQIHMEIHLKATEKKHSPDDFKRRRSVEKGETPSMDDLHVVGQRRKKKTAFFQASIADESKELHHQEITATYKLHQCALCNDQRGYQGNLNWKQVHEAHDNFVLRCSDCGESLGSHKLKTDYDHTHCKDMEQTITGRLDSDQNFSNIVLLMEDENTDSLIGCGEIHEIAAVKLEPSQGEMGCLPLEDNNCFEINILNQQGKLVPEKINEESDIESRLIEFSPGNSKDDYNTDNSMTDKESGVIPIPSSTSRSETDADQITIKMEIKVEDTTVLEHDEFEISTLNQSTITDCPYVDQHSKDLKEKYSELPLVEFSGKNLALTSDRKSDILEELVCTSSGQGVMDSTRVHHIEEDLRNIQVDLMSCNNQQEQNPTDQITLKMEITIEETTLMQYDDFGISTPNQSSITDYPYVGQHSKDQKVKNSELPSVEFSGQNLTLASEMKSDILEEFACTSLDQDIVDSCLNESKELNGLTLKGLHSANVHNNRAHLVDKGLSKAQSDTKVCSQEQETMNSEQSSVDCNSRREDAPPLVENPSRASSNAICSHCGKEFVSDKSLSYHIKSFHKSTTRNSCGKLFPDMEPAQNHKKTFHTEPGLKCPDCGKLFYYQSQLRRHMDVHLKAKQKRMRKNMEISEQQTAVDLEQNQDSSLQKSKACPICGLIIAGNMQYHKRTAHTEPTYECSQCPKMFYSNSDLNRHETTHSKTLERNLVCELCPNTFLDKFRLQEHVYNAHPPSELPCGMCDLKFCNRHKLRHHMKTFHAESVFKCPDCGKIYNCQSHLRRHMAVHLKTKQKSMSTSKEISEQQIGDDLEQNLNPSLRKSEACSICGLIICADMINHKLTAHTELKYKCSHCPKAYYIKTDLNHHKATHSKILEKTAVSKLCPNTFPYTHASLELPCSICDIMFSNRHKLYNHMKKAHAEPKQKCSQCPKMFYSNSELSRHETTTHSKTLEKNVACKRCPRTFRDKYKLQKHVYNAHHFSELPCDMCDLKFSNRPNLVYHMNTIHKPCFKCPECDKPFHTQSILWKHMNDHSKATEKQHSSDDFERRRSVAKEEKPSSDNAYVVSQSKKRKMPSSELRRSNRMRTKQ